MDQPSKEEVARLREEKKKAAEAAKAAKIAKAAEKKAQADKWRVAGEAANSNKALRLKSDFVNTVPAGEKKDVTGELAKEYNPVAVESAWYEWWVKSGFFSPEYVRPGQSAEEHAKSETFVMVIPPPNVTGALHIGHALTNSIEDLLARWHRMHGKRVLWVPGTDHAGIATQSVVEKRLAQDENLSRHDLGREKFVARVWEWKEKYGGRICTQLRRLGSSVDWSREAFTMDENLSLAVKEAFVKMYNDGLITRANRLVNWCCALQTCISDIECDDWPITEPVQVSVKGHPEDKKYEFGSIWSFAYQVVDEEGNPTNEEIIVATTRPETMLGDTAVAVHPEDEKYQHLHNKKLKHPFLPKLIPIVTDDKLVDKNFGTGAVKVTPGHDPNDYLCGVRKNLEFINILNDDGTLNANAGPFAGMNRYDARVAVLEKLEALGLYRGKKNNEMTLKVCSRSGDIIEPCLRPQWWVEMKELADKSLAAVDSGDLKISPSWKISAWKFFLENIKPWCISRQLWWGHRIPAYQYAKKGDPKPSLEDDKWIVTHTEEEALKKAQELLGTDDVQLYQDPDVLDTWFSSGLFPFSVMGWPKQTSDLEKYYPGHMLETGHDILFFWVARMVMMGLQLTGKLPFKEVLLHGIVRDATGEKMSKSKGNVIDPIDVIEGITLEGLHATLEGGNLKKKDLDEAKANQKKQFPRGISECGTDALRFSLCAYSNDGRDINLDIKRVEGYRAFCNKLWNAMKLSLMFLPKDYHPPESSKPCGKESNMDKWILSRLNFALKGTEEAFQNFDFISLTTRLHSFWLYDFCDVYLEALKPTMFAKGADINPDAQYAGAATLYTVLDSGLKALHPIMPYITEELWQHLPRRPNDETPSICVATYPDSSEFASAPEIEKNFDAVMNIIKKIRITLTEKNITKKGVSIAKYHTSNDALKALITEYNLEIVTLGYLKELTFTESPVEEWILIPFEDQNGQIFLSPEHIVVKKEQPVNNKGGAKK